MNYTDKEQIIQWMEAALELIGQLREENYKLKLEHTYKVVEIPAGPLTVDNPSKVCKCGRMYVRKSEQKCDICVGDAFRKRVSRAKKEEPIGG